MIEAVKGFCEFAFQNQKIEKIIAETETAASQNVLKKTDLRNTRKEKCLGGDWPEKNSIGRSADPLPVRARG
jgi:hypothetical protein